MGILAWIVVGLIAGWLNMPDAVNGFNVTSIFVAFVGAVILIAILRMVSGRRR